MRRSTLALSCSLVVQGLALLTDRVKEAAQRFYTRQGFTASPMLPMRLPL